MEIIHFFKPNSRGVTILLIYVDDMIVSSNNVEGVTSLTQQLATIFEIKILGNLQYFLGIEVACSHQDIFLSHLVVNGTPSLLLHGLEATKETPPTHIQPNQGI